LSKEIRVTFAYKFKEFEAEKAKERQGARNDLVESDTHIAQLVGKSEPSESENRGRGALGEIAKQAGVSHTTAEQYDAIQRKGTEEQKAEVAETSHSTDSLPVGLRQTGTAKRIMIYHLLNFLSDLTESYTKVETSS
jgi:hypothetical protein